ncbi:hypothetical protein [Cyanobium sp. NIES-981]|uniref:hypothetical protein n=1 Tax=Cyanobium sp. NIES-981 TaxID=1851505 RepID=UPI0018D4770A|nr:hypothetical protein [Cyanobium sp. NIES-981]
MAQSSHLHRGSPPETDWLSLTELGRLYGISAVLCGRQLSGAGLRQSHGAPTPYALSHGLALLAHPRAHHRSALWNRQACGVVLEQQGLQPVAQNRLVQLWADLLEALLSDSSAISTSAEEMAAEVPSELVGSVNQELRLRGSGFLVASPRRRSQPGRSQPSRKASACWRARSSMSRS